MMNNAFPIVELRVVITIIVILLALLTPAIDKAIYEVKKVVCSPTNIVQATQFYAQDPSGSCHRGASPAAAGPAPTTSARSSRDNYANVNPVIRHPLDIGMPPEFGYVSASGNLVAAARMSASTRSS
jgi:hypothetical protein